VMWSGAGQEIFFETRELQDDSDEEDEEMGHSGPPVLKLEAFLVGLYPGLKSSKLNHRPKFRVQPLQQIKNRVRRGWRRRCPAARKSGSPWAPRPADEQQRRWRKMLFT
jgi:hypothetical protein